MYIHTYTHTHMYMYQYIRTVRTAAGLHRGACERTDAQTHTHTHTHTNERAPTHAQTRTHHQRTQKIRNKLGGSGVAWRERERHYDATRGQSVSDLGCNTR